jgi:hypothetical protein
MTVSVALYDTGVNRFTDPAELAVYGEYDFPVSLACVPFQGHTRTHTLPESEWSGPEDERFPLAENGALCERIEAGVESGAYSVLQNGYDAVRTPTGPEFARPGDLRRKVYEGREYLESLFGEVSVFVPPDGRFSRAGLEAVKICGMDALYYPVPQHRPRDLDTVRTVARDALFKYRHRSTGVLRFVQDLYRFWNMEDRSVPLASRPTPYHVGGGWEFAGRTLLPSTDPERVRRQLALADRLDGGVCLGVDHWRFDDDRFVETFESVLGHARDLGAEFVHCPELFP